MDREALTSNISRYHDKNHNSKEPDLAHSADLHIAEQNWWQDVQQQDFVWYHPEKFNIGLAVLEGKPAEASAIIETGERELRVSFGQLLDETCRMGAWLEGQGIRQGDRVAVFLSQQYELAVVHLAAYLIGAIVVPLTTRFGPDAVQFRLRDSESRIIFGQTGDLQRVSSALEQVESLSHVVTMEEPPVGTSAAEFSYLTCLGAEPMSLHDVAVTDPDAPAVLIYTSGTTGNPKGALHAHRVLIGHMPGIRYTHDNFPQAGDMMWTPAEWAWIGGLFDVLMPSLACGIPVVASKSRFSPELAKHIFETVGARNAFLPPTALKQLRAHQVNIRHDAVRTIAAGGEPLGAELQAWSRQHLGVEINEFYGQTEMNLVIGQNRRREQPPQGSMGAALPGFEVSILDDIGEPVAPGATGEICVLTPNSGEFLGYWNQPEKTLEKYHGEYLRTGDLGKQDELGFFYFASRSDDVILSGGYRIGPAEIEEALLKHPSIAMAAVVGQPDEMRGEQVAAYVVLVDGVVPSDELKLEIQEMVKHSLAFYEYPKTLVFLDELPMTSTGKIQRRLLKKKA